MSGGMAYATDKKESDRNKKKVILRKKLISIIDEMKWEIAERIVEEMD